MDRNDREGKKVTYHRLVFVRCLLTPFLARLARITISSCH